jgi:hypothetical protein
MTNGVELIDIRKVPLKMALAAIGEHTLALGYARHQFTEEHDFTRDFRASHGTVEAVHNKSSDSYFGDCPSFQTNATYDSGMSGGPVNDQGGGYIGIVSRGAKTSEEVEPWGYATPVACLTELKIELESDDGSKHEWPFPELVAAGIVEVQRGLGFRLIHEASGLSLEWDDPSLDPPTNANPIRKSLRTRDRTKQVRVTPE